MFRYGGPHLDEVSPRWYPNDNDLQAFISDSANSPLAFANKGTTVFYNDYSNATESHAYYGMGMNLNSSVYPSPADMYINGVTPSVFSGNDTMNFGDLNMWPLNSNQRLKAIKISFRLYDQDRNHFPDGMDTEGKYFEYVIKLP